MATFKIHGIEAVMFTPDGTQHNMTVRKLLDDLNIEFTVDY